MRNTMLVLATAINFLALVCVILSAAVPEKPSTSYDQRQTGKYNIHLNIKDVAIIALESDDLTGTVGDTGSLYDDYYDYNIEDLTVSPIIALLGGPYNRTSTTKPIIEKPTVQTFSSSAKPIVKPVTVTTTVTTVVTTDVTAQNNTIKIENPPTVDLEQELIKNTVTNSQSYPNQIPVQIVMEPILKPKLRASNSLPIKSAADIKVLGDDQSIVNSRNGQNNKKCGRRQFRDKQGRCRNRRSGVRRIIDLLGLLNPKSK